MPDPQEDMEPSLAILRVRAPMVLTLIEDLSELHHQLNRASTPSMRRHYVRATFATIEGILWDMKRFLLRQELSALTFGELTLLQDVTFDADDAGQVKERQFSPRFRSNLLFTLRVHAKVHGYAPSFDLGSAGWQHMQRAIGIRHGLVHPKSADDLVVSDAALADVENAMVWFYTTFTQALRASQEAKNALNKPQ